MHSDKDPIVATATAAGRGAIGIVRLSFPERWNEAVLHALFGDRVGYYLRTGKHDVTATDWKFVLEFLRRNAPASAAGERNA